MKIKKWRADILLLSVFFIIGCVIGLFLFMTQKNGAKVQVRVAGELVETFDLGENQTFQIKGKNGGENLLIIQDGQAWIEEASCPDALCVKMGKIKKNAQSIICLPNQVVVEIVTETGIVNEGDEVDSVVGGQ